MLTRILTGLVGVPIVVWLLHSGGMLFNAAIFVLAAIGWLEFYNMAKNKGYNVFYFSSGIMTLVLVGSLMYLYIIFTAAFSGRNYYCYFTGRPA